MRIARIARRTTAVLLAGLVVAVLPLGSAKAAQRATWKVGDCFSRADVNNDLVDLTSAVPCASPHAVQVIGGARLPGSLSSYSLAELLDQQNSKLRSQLVDFSEQTCSGTRTASAIWPKQGAAIAKVLTGPAATAGGGVLPGLKQSVNYGWVFPDATSFNSGNRSLVCVIYPLDAASGDYVANSRGLRGNAQLLGTSRTLPTMRACFAYDASGADYGAVPCSRPHGDELLAFFAGRLPADVSTMTAAQWAPFDRQCAAIMDILVGATRSDLTVVANPPPDKKANTLIYIPCFASQLTAADGTRPNLPGGTLVGLGNRPLSKA